jgi:glucose-6-phosphate 1-dehydrogenase
MNKPTMIVLFGSTGSLAKLKLMPALYSLYKSGHLKGSIIAAIGRREFNKKLYLEHIKPKDYFPDTEKLEGFTNILHYVKHQLNSRKLHEALSQIDPDNTTGGNRVYYLAVPPGLFSQALDTLKDQPSGYKRIIFEKPFGHSFKSAMELNNKVKALFKEEEVFRIDHYLGKGFVQNILAFRFANTLFEQVWCNDFIDNVQITASETEGVGQRKAYYDKSGAVRDMIQNHLMQILALTAMESPKSLKADDIRDRKVKVIKRLAIKEAVFGQYRAGKVEGNRVKGYDEEIGSATETYAAMRIAVRNRRWKGVPFYIRTGKRMGKKEAVIKLCLKDVACRLFCTERIHPRPNTIELRIQPRPSLTLKLNAKVPGTQMRLDTAEMEFCYECKYGENTTEAYEMLIHQVLAGDTALFARIDEVLESWRLLDPIIEGMQKTYAYPAGSMGPKEADRLLAGREWL